MNRQNFDYSIIKEWKNKEIDNYDKIKKQFNKISYQYEPFLISIGKYSIWKKINKIIKPYVSKTSSILDICCGTGLIGEILNNNGYKNIIGLDISEKMLERIKSKEGFLNKKIYKELINCNIMDFKPSIIFDLTVCVGSLVYFKNKKDLINHVLQFSKIFIFTNRNDDVQIGQQISEWEDYLPGFEDYKGIKVAYFKIEKGEEI